jgi:muconolactone D-isomerase
MEFLVRIRVKPLRGLSTEMREELTRAETARGKQLRANGTISRIWRVPGRRENVGVWNAEDASKLHAAIASLPMYDYFDATVTALAEHPVEATR